MAQFDTCRIFEFEIWGQTLDPNLKLCTLNLQAKPETRNQEGVGADVVRNPMAGVLTSLIKKEFLQGLKYKVRADTLVSASPQFWRSLGCFGMRYSRVLRHAEIRLMPTVGCPPEPLEAKSLKPESSTLVPQPRNLNSNPSTLIPEAQSLNPPRYSPATTFILHKLSSLSFSTTWDPLTTLRGERSHPHLPEAPYGIF